MIDECFTALEPMLGTQAACRAVGRSRASHYRRQTPPASRSVRARPAPATKLSDEEIGEILDALRSPRFVDLSPAQVFHILLDEGTYLASVSSFYRLLRANGEVRERRRQATHPARVRPELVARRPLVVWSWDITKLKGPRRGEYYDLYVVIDIFSRYVVAWLAAPAESGELAKELIADAVARHQVPPGQLTIHADRGSSMTSNPVAELLVFLGIGRSHSRPHVSNDNPFSEAQFKTLKYSRRSPNGSDPSPTPGRSARASSPTTTTTIAIPGSAITRPPRFTTAPPPRCAPSASTPSTPPTLPTPHDSGTADPNRQNSQLSPG